ncbi:MAG: hypothetical protein EXS32_08185 [Opitutus sp.]|nr:hypothetical protein [Opitutus sp.]
MSLLDKLERALGRFAVPNLSLYLVIGQAFVLLAGMLRLVDLGLLVLVPAAVGEGQWWRVVTFLFIPPPLSYLFVAFALYMFYLMGNALEGAWGAFRYNAFLLVGWALTVGVAFFNPGAVATNTFLAGSVFLAFAYLYPDFELLIFFILPVKIKWLALLTWAGYGVKAVLGSWPVRLQILAAVGNFLLFFGPEIWASIRYGRRKMAREVKKIVHTEDEARHRCHVCGKTDLTHPALDFRYCSKCAGDQCYCPEHIQSHAHVVAADEKSPG